MESSHGLPDAPAPAPRAAANLGSAKCHRPHTVHGRWRHRLGRETAGRTSVRIADKRLDTRQVASTATPKSRVHCRRRHGTPRSKRLRGRSPSIRPNGGCRSCPSLCGVSGSPRSSHRRRRPPATNAPVASGNGPHSQKWRIHRPQQPCASRRTSLCLIPPRYGTNPLRNRRRLPLLRTLPLGRTPPDGQCRLPLDQPRGSWVRPHSRPTSFRTAIHCQGAWRR